MTVDLSKTYTVNMQHTPATTFLTFWSSYNSSATLTGFQAAKAMGFNTVRLIIPAESPAFSFPTPSSPQLANLTDACAQAVTAGVKLHICLFDHWQNYGQIANSKTWITAILGALNLSQVFCIEPQNEAPFLSDPGSRGTPQYVSGFDSGWPGYPTVPTNPSTPQNQIGTILLQWAELIIPYLQAATTVPITACSSYASATITDQVTGYAAAGVTPSWYEYHTYVKTPYSSANVISDLTAAVAAASPAQIFVGEFGMDSTLFGQIPQAQWLQVVRNACNQLGLPEPAIWELYDNQFVVDDNFGLIDVNSVKKPAGYLYSKYPPGSRVPALGSHRWDKVSGQRCRLVGPAY